MYALFWDFFCQFNCQNSHHYQKLPLLCMPQHWPNASELIVRVHASPVSTEEEDSMMNPKGGGLDRETRKQGGGFHKVCTRYFGIFDTSPLHELVHTFSRKSVVWTREC